jgi:hypothetical protein
MTMGAAVLIGGLAGAAHAAPSVDLVAADNALKAKIEAAAAAGTAPPTLADDGAEIRSAYSLEALASAPSDIEGQLNICGAAYGSQAAYLTFGGDPNQLDQALAGRNEVRFQNEIAIGFRFDVVCFARAAPLIQAFVAKLAPGDWTPTRRQGMTQMREGLTETFTGLATMANDPISLANREIILGAAATNAPALIALMPVPERQALAVKVDAALQAPGLSAALKADLGSIRTALNSTDCVGVCAL